MQENKLTKNIAIIGGGVSGVTAALSLPAHYQVTIFERDNRLLKKLLKTGNGKANIYNLHVHPNSYNHDFLLKHHPNMVKEVINFYHQLGIYTLTDEEGRGYPYSQSAKALANQLVARLGTNVKVVLSTEVKEVIPNQHEVMINGQSFDQVMITTGSSAYQPTVDVSNDNASLFDELGVAVTPFFPTSGPIMVKENLKLLENERISGKLVIKDKGRVVTEEKGEILFKKDSLSGICSFIAQSRLTWDYRKHPDARYQVEMNLIDGHEEAIQALLSTRPLDQHILYGLFSENLEQYLLSRLSKPLTLTKVMKGLTSLSFTVSDTFVLTKERGQLMSGGVALDEINYHTFALKKYPHIYLGGEVIDLDGVSGGYNLMWAVYASIVVSQDIIDK